MDAGESRVGIRAFASLLCRLFRLRLALANGISAVGGYLLFPSVPEVPQLLALFAGVSLLAAAGSTLNQVIEQDRDALMLRTMKRPLPRGEISTTSALLIGAACNLAGELLLAAFGGAIPALLGAAALLWYLALYTPLKSRTSFALAVGAVCGALPPVIGWCLAGGSPLDFRVVLLAGIIYLWQVPHFWLLQRRHAEDYRRAGIPLFAPSRKRNGLGALFRLWIVALCAGVLMLPAFGMVGSTVAYCCVILSIPLVYAAFFKCSERALFVCLNLFPILVTLVVCVGK
jgi:heme o synthase